MEAPSWGHPRAFVKNCFIYPKLTEPKAINCEAAMSNPSYPKHMFLPTARRRETQYGARRRTSESGFLKGKPGKWMVTGADPIEKVVERWEAHNPGYVLEVQLHFHSICSYMHE